MMRRQQTHPVIAKIADEVEQTVSDYGYEMVQVTYGGRGNNRVISVYIDKPGGVAASDCQHMAEQLSLLLDTLDPVPGAYHLVVSSPGVERPLLRDSDFERFAGRAAAITSVTDEEKQTREGILRGLEQSDVILEVDGEPMHIPLENVERAHLVYEFDDDLLE